MRHALARGSLLVALVTLAFSQPVYTAPRDAKVDAKEKALVSHVSAGEQASIALLEQLVNVNSGTMNFAGVRQVADMLRPRFEALGFKVSWVDGTPFGRAGHLVATRAGRGPHVLLIGHLDTVFEPNHPFQRWERVDENIARGPGAADMKGGIVVALAALDALSQANLLDSLQLTVVLHGDEEDSGRPLDLARRDLIEAAKAADIAIALENAADNPKTAVTARRSSTGWIVKVEANSAHSSQIFAEDVGAGAAYELGRILNGFYQEVRGDALVTFNPGLIASSTQVDFEKQPLGATLSGKNNIIAPTAIASGDLRTLTVQQLEETRAKMRKVVAASLPHTSAQIEFTDSYPPMAPTEGNRKLLSMYDEVSRDLGFGAVTEVDPRNAGAADISFAADHVDMAIDGLGLLGGDSHTPEEFADLRTYPIQTQRLAVLLYRLGKK
ncbi:MAG TPA: M20/M25/M40 family metallo-hydrolase [Steroidobacter sp.]|uniref:M20/M25/M40 family metallo-hydrolase n=1 Tax=Steroidobacter sp. TaxID=1978227 RepID=UPI002ED8800F